jgi:hypothetical protein
MHSKKQDSGDRGSIGTGRIVTLAILLVIAGIAAPRLRALFVSTAPSGSTGTPRTFAGELSRVGDAARAITTRQRMKCIKTELKLWSATHGMPKASELAEAVGEDTATDGWGRRILFAPPTESEDGYLRSRGPNIKLGKDDVTVVVTWKDLHRSIIAPAWQ